MKTARAIFLSFYLLSVVNLNITSSLPDVARFANLDEWQKLNSESNGNWYVCSATSDSNSVHYRGCKGDLDSIQITPSSNEELFSNTETTNFQVRDVSDKFLVQTLNSKPTMYVSRRNFQNSEIEGIFRVIYKGSGWKDNDFFGFVIGLEMPTDEEGSPDATQFPTQFILLDWKAGDQTIVADSPSFPLERAYRHLRVSAFSGVIPEGVDLLDGSLFNIPNAHRVAYYPRIPEENWYNPDELPHDGQLPDPGDDYKLGWVFNVDYRIRIKYTAQDLQVRMKRADGLAFQPDNVPNDGRWSSPDSDGWVTVFDINRNTNDRMKDHFPVEYPIGRIGFYGYSQPNTRYGMFTTVSATAPSTNADFYVISPNNDGNIELFGRKNTKFPGVLENDLNLNIAYDLRVSGTGGKNSEPTVDNGSLEWNYNNEQGAFRFSVTNPTTIIKAEYIGYNEYEDGNTEVSIRNEIYSGLTTANLYFIFISVSIEPAVPKTSSPYIRCNPGADLGDLAGTVLKYQFTWYLDDVKLDFGTGAPQDLVAAHYQFRPNVRVACSVKLEKVSFNPNEGTIYDGDETFRSSDATVTPGDLDPTYLTGIIRDFKKDFVDMDKPPSPTTSEKSVREGICDATLSIDEIPMFNAANNDAITTIPSNNLGPWYITNSAYNLAKSYSIALTPSSGGDAYYLYHNENFFPIDNIMYGNEGNSRNYHFTYELSSYFVFTPETFIEVGCRDDCWLFIDRTLRIDLGGLHASEPTKTVNLGELGFSTNSRHLVQLFYAKRHTQTGSSLLVKHNAGLECSVVASGSTVFDYSSNICDLQRRLGAATQDCSGNSFTLLSETDFQHSDGTAWHNSKVNIANGFETEFTFQIKDNGGGKGHGFAFIIQNGGGVTARGGEMGYAGISNAFVVEFDTHKTEYYGDLDDNHISVHASGSPNVNNNNNNNAVSASETINQYILGRNSRGGLSRSVGQEDGSGVNLSDGDEHHVRIIYEGSDQKLSIYIDNKVVYLAAEGSNAAATLSIRYSDVTLTDMIGDSSGYVGFSAGNNYGNDFDVNSCLANVNCESSRYIIKDWSMKTVGESAEQIQFKDVGDLSFTAGKTSTINIQAYDACGSIIEYGGARSKLKVGISIGGVDVTENDFTSIVDNNDGSYAVELRTNKAGGASIGITYGDYDSLINSGNRLQGIVVSPGVLDRDHTCVIRGGDTCSKDVLESVQAGEDVTWIIQTRDSFQNNLITGGATISVSLGIQDDNLYEIENSQDNGDGTYTVNFKIFKSATYSMTISVASTPIPGEYLVEVSPNSVHPPNCVADGSGLTRGGAGDETSFEIITKDIHGNELTQSTSIQPVVTITSESDNALSSDVLASLIITPRTVNSVSTGIFDVTYVINIQAKYKISISFSNVPSNIANTFQDSVYEINIYPGSHSPSHSTATFSSLDSGVTAGGVSYIFNHK